MAAPAPPVPSAAFDVQQILMGPSLCSSRTIARHSGPRRKVRLVVAAHVDTLSYPWLLLGDFNDGPSSRTLRLFAARVRPERKSPAASETFPADAPVGEIDYVFASQGTSWEVREIQVVADSVTSDHRPVVATVRRRGI